MIRYFLLILFITTVMIMHAAAQSIPGIVIDSSIQLIHLKDSVFIDVTWDYDGNFRFSSNGMLFVRNGKALLIDTPMDNKKTEKLIVFLKDSMNIEVTKLIIGHFHNDCLGGLECIKSRGIESVANYMTIDKCKELGLPLPSTSFRDSLVFDYFGEQVVCRYFGAGHTADNITVWFPSEKILFGGCLIRSMSAKNLGNLSDAVVKDWDATVKKIIQKYPDIDIVVPGHGEYGGSELLDYTIKLVELEKKQGDGFTK
jgi:metallo-beta-lactamase class B